MSIIKKKNVTFVTMFIILHIFSYLVLYYNYQQTYLNELSNQFYTGNQVVLNNIDFEEWPEIQIESSEHRIFIEYGDTFRLFKQKYGNWEPPLLSGRFFNNEENGNKAVVGKEMKNLIFYKKETQFITFQNENYEVIGIVGDSFTSSADFLVLLSSSNIPIVENARLIIDSDNSKEIEEVSKYLTEKDNSIMLEKGIQKGLKRNTSSLLFKNLFLLSSILVILLSIMTFLRYWFEKEKLKMNLLFIFGIPQNKIWLDYFVEITLKVLVAGIIASFIFFVIQPLTFNNLITNYIVINVLFILTSLLFVTIYIFISGLSKACWKRGSLS